MICKNSIQPCKSGVLALVGPGEEFVEERKLNDLEVVKGVIEHLAKPVVNGTIVLIRGCSHEAPKMCDLSSFSPSRKKGESRWSEGT